LVGHAQLWFGNDGDVALQTFEPNFDIDRSAAIDKRAQFSANPYPGVMPSS